MKNIKVLVVDKDILARQTIAKILRAEGGLNVSVSGNFDEVTNIIQQEDPDVVLLNAEHDASDGLSSFNAIRHSYPGLPIVLLSPRTEEGARLAIEALRRGAIDFITKPEHTNILLFARRHLVKRLSPVIKAASKTNDDSNAEQRLQSIMGGAQYKFKDIDTRRSSGPEFPVSVVTIGGCTGAPHALFSIFESFPADLPVPIVVVQHFPKIYTRELARMLDKNSNITVREAFNGAELMPGTAWLAPGGYHSEVQQEGSKSVINVHRGPRVNGVRPSIDVLFRSAARLFGSQTLGVLLSGCGYDGLEGARTIRECGGEIMVQDPESALAPVLPMSAIKSGLANYRLTAEQIGGRIINRVSHEKSGAVRSEEKQFGFSSYPSDRVYFNPV